MYHPSEYECFRLILSNYPFRWGVHLQPCAVDNWGCYSNHFRRPSTACRHCSLSLWLQCWHWSSAGPQEQEGYVLEYRCIELLLTASSFNCGKYFVMHFSLVEEMKRASRHSANSTSAACRCSNGWRTSRSDHQCGPYSPTAADNRSGRTDFRCFYFQICCWCAYFMKFTIFVYL